MDAGHEAGLPVAPPDPPVLTDWICPEGWLSERLPEGEPAGVSVCLPHPRVACTGASVQGPADAACRRVGSACPETVDGFPSEDDVRARAKGFAGPVVWVRAGAAPGGDGTRERPFLSLIPVVMSYPADGTIVALAPGTYRTQVAFDTGVAVVGACAELTVIEGPADGFGVLEGLSHPHCGTVIVQGRGAALLADLTVRGERTGISVIDVERPVTLRDLVIERPVAMGVEVGRTRAAVRLESVVVRDVRPGPEDLVAGIHIVDGADTTLAGCAVEGSAGPGVTAAATAGSGPVRLVVEDGFFSDGAPGLQATGHVELAVRRTVLDDNRMGGVWAGLWGAAPPAPVVLLEDVAVRGTVLGDADLDPNALLLAQGAELEARRVRLEANEHAALGIWVGSVGERASAYVEDLVIRGVWAPDGVYGSAVAALGDVRVTLRRALLDSNLGVGVLAGAVEPDRPPEVTVEDLWLRRSLPVAGIGGTGGLHAFDGARVGATRVRLEDMAYVALLAYGWEEGRQTRVRASHLSVAGVVRACGEAAAADDTPCEDKLGRRTGGGLGVASMYGADLGVADFSIRGAELAGLLLGESAELRAARGVVSECTIGINAMDAGEIPDNWLDEVFLIGNRTEVAQQQVVLPRPDLAVALD